MLDRLLACFAYLPRIASGGPAGKSFHTDVMGGDEVFAESEKESARTAVVAPIQSKR